MTESHRARAEDGTVLTGGTKYSAAGQEWGGLCSHDDGLVAPTATARNMTEDPGQLKQSWLCRDRGRSGNTRLSEPSCPERATDEHGMERSVC